MRFENIYLNTLGIFVMVVGLSHCGGKKVVDSDAQNGTNYTEENANSHRVLALESVEAIDYRVIRATFNEPLAPASAENLENFELTGDPVLSLSASEVDANHSNAVLLKVNKNFHPRKLSLIVKTSLKSINNHELREQAEKSFIPASKVMFITKTLVTGNIGAHPNADGKIGLAAADHMCEKEAEIEGLKGKFVAYLSTSTENAIDRISDDWEGAYVSTREDRHPLGDFSADKHRLLVPETYTAEGGTAPYTSLGTLILSGSKDDGTYFTNGACNDWTTDSSNSTMEAGNTQQNPGSYLRNHISAGCQSEGLLLCVQKGKSFVMPDYRRNKGQHIFVTDSAGNGNLSSWSNAASGTSGILAGDSICQKEAQLAMLPGFQYYKAYLSDASTDARSRFQNTSTYYYSSDGVVVAEEFEDLMKPKKLLGLITNSSNTAVTVFGTSTVFTGTTSQGVKAADHCQSWTTSSASFRGQIGEIRYSYANEMFDQDAHPCSISFARLICIQDKPL